MMPSYSTNSAVYTSTDPLFAGLGSTLVLNSQLYGRPLHKGNLTFDAFNPPSGIELLANAQYVGVNNQQHIAPYVNVSFGITHPFGIGMLTLFETNAFNTETGLFSTITGAYPQPLTGGGFLLVPSNPLPPRTIQLSYTFNTGAKKGAGARACRVPRRARGGQTAARRRKPDATPAPSGIRALGFGEMHFVAPPDAASTLRLATSRAECTPESARRSRTPRSRNSAPLPPRMPPERRRCPPVTGVSVTPHGDPKGAWYFALGPNIPRDALPRPPKQARRRRRSAACAASAG